MNNGKIPVKPEVCDNCKETSKLVWNKNYRMWLCSFCEEDFIEKECVYEDDEEEYDRKKNYRNNWGANENI